MPPEIKQNGWAEWSKHVLHELERMNDCLEKLRDDQQAVDKRLTILEIRAGLFGALGGSLPVLIYILIDYFNSHAGPYGQAIKGRY